MKPISSLRISISSLEVVGETISSTGFPVRCRIKNTTTVMPKIAMMDCPSRLSKYFPMLFNLS